MWLGRDAVRLDRLLGFICENTRPDDALRITTSLGPVLTAEAGDVSLKRSSFWRRREAAILLIRSEKKRGGAYKARDLIDAIQAFSKSSSEGSVVVKIQMNGKLHQLQGDIKLEPAEGEDGTFFLSASTVIAQVFEEPGIWETGRLPLIEKSEEDQAPEDEADLDEDSEKYLDIEIEDDEASEGPNAWANAWTEQWSEVSEDDYEDELEDDDEFEDEEPEAEEDEPEAEAESEDEDEAEEEPEDEPEAEAETEPETEADDEKTDEDDEPSKDAEEIDEESEDDVPRGKHAAK